METKEVGTLIKRPPLCQSADPHREERFGRPVTCMLPFGHEDGPCEGKWYGVVVRWGYPPPPPPPPTFRVKAVEGKSEVGENEDPFETAVASMAAYEEAPGVKEMLRKMPPCEYTSYPDATPAPYEHEGPPPVRPLKDPASFESWVQDAAQIFQGGDTHFPPTELEVAWSRIEHRAQLIKNQLEAGRDKAAAYSYIKSTALLLAMRAAQAALDSLSELIPA